VNPRVETLHGHVIAFSNSSEAPRRYRMDNNFLAGRLYLACVRTAKRGALGVLLTAAAIASYCGIIRYMGNIHVVEEGQLYRSAQLDKG
jgi:hypothetical protein